MIAATIGSIFVDRKNPSTFSVRLIGASDNAYAAGMPSRSTNTVESTVTNAELARYGRKPRSTTPANCSQVGVNTTDGGSV